VLIKPLSFRVRPFDEIRQGNVNAGLVKSFYRKLVTPFDGSSREEISPRARSFPSPARDRILKSPGRRRRILQGPVDLRLMRVLVAPRSYYSKPYPLRLFARQEH